MTTVTLAPSEDKIFDAVWGFIASLFDASLSANIFKGFQNLTSTPLGSYIVISPGIAERQDQGVSTYDSVGGFQNVTRGTTYSYQVDCYGPSGPDWSNIIAIAWRSLWACDAFAGLPIMPLYADEPQQLNIVNGELQYEQRFTLKMYLQANQTVSLPQLFFSAPVPIDILPPADDLPA